MRQKYQVPDPASVKSLLKPLEDLRHFPTFSFQLYLQREPRSPNMIFTSQEEDRLRTEVIDGGPGESLEATRDLNIATRKRQVP